MASSIDFSRLFQAVAAQLQQHRHYWQLLPFECEQLPWANQELQQQLLAFSDAELAAIDQQSALQQHYFQHFFPQLFNLPLYLQAKHTKPAHTPFWLTTGINGRKLEQIQAFCQQIGPVQSPVLEWCAGKGHLGRLLASQQQCQVSSVEWQPELCQQGQQLADKFELPQRFIRQDVLAPHASVLLQQHQQALALHACGQLHISLLQHGVAAGCPALDLVPCCYHLISHPVYQPLSGLAQQHDFTLTRQDLKLAVQGQVTAGARIEKLRQTELQWRLAYQELRAQLAGDRQYQPLSSVAKHWFTGQFSEFAHWAATEHQLTLPAGINWQAYLQTGEERARLVRRIELIQHLFRRPLELYLVLDRALYLQEHGYQVSIKAFCDYQITPRNLLIQARK